MITNNDLKKSSENFYIDKNELLNDIIVATDKKAIHLPSRPMRRLSALFIALLVILCGCVTAYAVSPQFRNYLNLWFMTDSKQQETVPEDYTGIYTIDDLNNVRNDLSGKYILMSDLTFSDGDFTEGGAYAGGWIAIGDDSEPFMGIFDGNGYVISNLKLNTDGNVGLFGRTGILNKVQTREDVSKLFDESADEYIYDSESYGGLIKNLGLNGLSADIHITKDNFGIACTGNTSIPVGTFAAYGTYIVGCYATDVNISITLDDYELTVLDDQTNEDGTRNMIDVTDKKDEIQYSVNIDVGGICGRAYIIDSCYANANIDIIDNNNDHIFVNAGGVAAISQNLVTSYFNGKITNNDIKSETILAYNYLLPSIVTEKCYNEICEAIKAKGLELGSERIERVFKAYFTKRALFQSEKDLLYGNSDSASKCFILDPAVTPKEITRLDDIIRIAYTEEEFNQLLINNGIKTRINYCYVLNDGESYEQGHFEQFDFENIWVMKDGVPVLQIFE